MKKPKYVALETKNRVHATINGRAICGVSNGGRMHHTAPHFKETDKAVNCKQCLKVMARGEETTSYIVWINGKNKPDLPPREANDFEFAAAMGWAK